MLFIGDDWAEDHHDVEIVNATGDRLARRRLPEGVAGLAGLHALIADISVPTRTPPKWSSGSRPTVARGCRR